MSIVITQENFAQEVSQATEAVLVDFWADWCGPCRMLAPVLEELAQERADIKIGKVNVDEQEALAEKFGIRSIPTVVLFRNGKEVNRSVGLVEKQKLLALL